MKAPSSLNIRFTPSIVLNIKYTISESLNFANVTRRNSGILFSKYKNIGK